MSIILFMSFCIVLFVYFLSMLMTAILLSLSCPIVSLKNFLMCAATFQPWQDGKRVHCKYLPLSHTKALEKFSKALYGITGGTYSARIFRPVMLYRTGKMSWRPLWPLRLRFFSGMGPRSRSFQLIAFHYPRHRNLIQFGYCWCLENGWIRFRSMRTKPPGHRPQTLIEVHWRLCQ